MGMLHDNVSTIIPFTAFAHSAGTWTPSVASNVWYTRRTAADAAAVTYVPLGGVPQSDGVGSMPVAEGVMLNSVEFHFRISSAALDAMEAHLYKATLAADGSLLTVAEVTTTYDAGHDAAAERIDADEHLMTLTPSAPAFLDKDEMLFLEVVYDGSAAGVIDEFLAKANWTLRL